MNITIVNNMVPFVWGGAEELAVHLQKNLMAAGHQVELLRIPFQWEPAARIPSQMLMTRNLELPNSDRVIALKFPAYLIRHPHKTLWLVHQYRQAYDLFDAGQTNLPSGNEGKRIQDCIKAADAQCFAECRHIFTNSKVTQKRLFHYNGFQSTVLLPPVNDPEIFFDEKQGDYIFAGGRINTCKRQHLLVQALALTTQKVKLLIAGPADTPEDGERLERMVAQLHLEERVTLDIRLLPRSTYADYINRAFAVAYLPYDEDSLGYVSMEAASAQKPLLSTTDSGGILELAQNGHTGWVTGPTPEALARAMDAMWLAPQNAARYGKAAKARWNALGITWPKTVEALLR